MRRLSEIADIADEMGEGYAGRVHRGRLLQDAFGMKSGDTIAVKIIKPVILNAEARMRITRELIAGQLSESSNLVRAFEICEADYDGIPTIALLMEFVDGMPLHHFIQMHAPVATETLLQVAGDLIKALASLHDRGAVHRDVKPQNIMIADGRAILMDLGVVEFPGQDSLTKSNQFLGTIRYASREALFEGKADDLSDMWSLGATLYQLLYAHEPYEQQVHFAEWVVSVKQKSLSIRTAKNRFGLQPATVDHLRMEALVRELLNDRQERPGAGSLQGVWLDAVWPPYIGHLESLAARVVREIYNEEPIFPCFSWCILRVRKNLGITGLEKLALFTTSSISPRSLLKDRSVTSQINLGLPSPEEFQALERNEKIEIRSSVFRWMVQGISEEVFRDMYGYPDYFYGYFGKLAEKESDAEIKKQLLESDEFLLKA